MSSPCVCSPAGGISESSPPHQGAATDEGGRNRRRVVHRGEDAERTVLLVVPGLDAFRHLLFYHNLSLTP